MISSGRRSASARSRSRGQTFLGTLQDVERQPLVQRQRGALLDRRLALALAEVSGERRDRIVAAPPDQILGQPALLFGNRRIALQLLGIDDRQVQTRLHAMVEHHRVEHFAPGFGQAEGDVGDAQDGLAARQGGLDRADALDGLDARTDIVAVAGADREHQRVEEDVFRRDAVLIDQQVERTLRDCELALARDRLRLLLVLVDTADHQGGAIAPGQLQHPVAAARSLRRLRG